MRGGARPPRQFPAFVLGELRVRGMAQDNRHNDDACIPGVDLLGCGRVARRLLPVGLIFSMALHVAVVAGGLWLAVAIPHREMPAGVYEVEIIRPEPPAPPLESAPASLPAPLARPAPEKGQVAGQETAAPAPQAEAAASAPAPAPASAPATESLDLAPPARVADADPGLAAPEAPAEPGVLDIAPRRERPVAPGPVAAADAGPVVGVVQRAGETDVGGLRGFAGRADTFGLDRLAREEFELREFAGFYRVQGQPDRHLVVVDALATRGRLLLLDPETRFLRALKPHNPMVYSYGFPGGGDEPVQGVVYLMPRKARYENDNINLPHQVVWMRDEPPALVAQMVRIREQDVTVRSRGRELRGLAAMPLGPGPFPGVVWLPGGCEPAAVREGFARSLAVRGLAALVFDYPGCEARAGETSRVSLDDLAQDAAAALAELRRQAGVDPARCGVWGRDRGLWVALRAAASAPAGEGPAFVLAAASASDGAGEEPALALPEADARAVAAPQLWLLSAPRPERVWRRGYTFLDGLARAGRPVEVTLFPEDSVAAGDEAAALTRQLVPWCADAGARWVLGRR